MRLYLVVQLVIVGLCISVHPAFAQNPDKVRENVFRLLFPNPTGQNGYEELVLAGDLVMASATWRQAEQKMDQLTLQEKRRLLDVPDVKKTLVVLRQGLSKQVSSPHKEIDAETRLPEMARFRALARLLSVHMYVQLADGRAGDAIDSMVEALKFGYAIQRDTLVGGLVGIAVDAIGMKMISDHLDQLSAKDCDRLLTIVNQWMELPDPSLDLIAKEREIGQRLLKKYRDRPEKLIEILTIHFSSNPPSPNAARLDEMARGFKENAGSAGPIFDEVADKLGSSYDRADQSFRKPVWDRNDLDKQSSDNTPSGIITNELFPRLALISDRYGREQAMVQLLGAHAAIRRYRWEHNRLPDSLDALKLGRLAIDPFTGTPLSYKKLDEKTYELSSEGPVDRRDEAVQGARVKIK